MPLRRVESIAESTETSSSRLPDGSPADHPLPVTAVLLPLRAPRATLITVGAAGLGVSADLEGAVVSDLWTSPSGEEEAASRRRALWGLVALVAIGVLVGLLMVFLGRSRPGAGGGEGLVGVAPSSSASQPAVSAITSQARHPTASSTPTRSASTTGPVKPTGPASHCPSTAPCVVAGDDGGAAAALNALRTSHGRAAVPGAATGQAQQCALNQGNGPACAPHYAWQPVSTRDGTTVINMIANRSDGLAWLLDPDMTSFSVGWAYLPGAGVPGQYSCAILKVG